MENALQFESRFSLPPNSLGYCGRKTAAYQFKQCITKGKCENIKKEVSKFIVLYPYLKTLGKITKLPKFSKEVIEGYWIGNDLLKKTKIKDYELLLKYFANQGVPKFFVDELKQKKPKKFIPTHLFHVLFIGVGKASGAVEFNLESVNNCMIRFGKVENKTPKYMIIKLNSLKVNKKNIYKLFTKKEKIRYEEEIIQDVKIGDTVAVHWQMVIKKLDKEELLRLEYWTNEVLKLEP